MRGVALSILLAAVTIAACSQGASAPSGPVNAQVVLAPGETADVSGAAIRLRFVGVMGDSRCPAGALCIQGGDAVVRIVRTAVRDAARSLRTPPRASARAALASTRASA